MTSKETIRMHMSKLALLCQLAEEASELSQAAMKVVRAEGMVYNPTPVTGEEAWDNLAEELADVILVADVLDIKPKDIGYKYYRWLQRLGLTSKEQ